MYTHKNRVPIYVKQKLIELKEQIEKHTLFKSDSIF